MTKMWNRPPSNAEAFLHSADRFTQIQKTDLWNVQAHELRLLCVHFFGSAWRAAGYLIWESVQWWWILRIWDPIRSAAHRLGIHDRTGIDGGCLQCEAEAWMPLEDPETWESKMRAKGLLGGDRRDDAQ